MTAAAAFALVVAASIAAGWGVARHVLRGLVDVEHRLLAAALCGAALVAAGTIAGAVAGAAAAGAALALLAGGSLLARGGITELRDALRATGMRWLGWTAAAAVWTALLHVRHVTLGPDAVSWRGTLGWELWVQVLASRAVDGEPPLSWLGPFPAARMDYHFGAHAAAAGWAKLSGADLVVVHARLLPIVLFATAFEAHRSFLRTWFPAGRPLAAAALLPALVSDLDVWLRLAGIAPVPEFEHRLAVSFAVSPSFVLGQAHALFALGLLLRAGRAASLTVRDAAGLGALLGATLASKAPSFVVAAIGAAAVTPWLARRCGWRAVAVAATSTLAVACLAALVCFPGVLGPRTGATEYAAARWAPLEPFTRAVGAGGGAVALVLLWLAQSLGPRVLRLGQTIRSARDDASWRAVLAMLAAAAILPLVVEIGLGQEEKYLMRCGAAPALLVTGALVFGDLAARRRRAWIETAVLALFTAGTAWHLLRPAAVEGSLTRDEIAALRSLPGGATLDASVPERLGVAAAALSGTSLPRGDGPTVVAATASRAATAGRVVFAGPTLVVLERE